MTHTQSKMGDIEVLLMATWIARMDDEPQKCELLYRWYLGQVWWSRSKWQDQNVIFQVFLVWVIWNRTRTVTYDVMPRCYVMSQHGIMTSHDFIEWWQWITPVEWPRRGSPYTRYTTCVPLDRVSSSIYYCLAKGSTFDILPYKRVPFWQKNALQKDLFMWKLRFHP